MFYRLLGYHYVIPADCPYISSVLKINLGNVTYQLHTLGLAAAPFIVAYFQRTIRMSPFGCDACFVLL